MLHTKEEEWEENPLERRRKEGSQRSIWSSMLMKLSPQLLDQQKKMYIKEKPFFSSSHALVAPHQGS